MFRILVVDDEYYIRDGLCNAIDWQSIDAQIVGQASSGIEALAKVPLVNPDVVITDIRMEDMDGLTLAENLKTLRSEIQLVFLSGYDDFSYAQKAIKLGAAGYILKPGEPNEVLNAVEKAFIQIEANRHKSALKNSEMKNLSVRQGYFLENIINRRILDKDIETTAKELGWRESEAYSLCILVPTDFYDTELAEDAGRLYSDLLLMQDIIMTATKHILFAHVFECSLILVIDSQKNNNTIMSEIENILNTVSDHHGISVFASVGNCVENVSELYTSYSRAKIQLEYIFVLKDKHVITPETTPVSAKYVYPKACETAILEAIKNHSRTDVSIAVNVLVDEFMEKKYSKSQLKAALAELYAVVNRRIMPSDIDLYQIFEQKWLDPYYVLECFNSISEIENWLCSLFIEVINRMKNNKTINAKKVVTQVHEFIHRNYSNADLSLSMIADFVFLNSTYLSRLYKKETGCNYVEYLIEYRMKEAQRLLKDSSLRVGDVSVMVGYPNSQYFCTTFKKYCGCSPIEYREKNEEL